MLGTPVPTGCRGRGYQSEPGDAVQPSTGEGLVFSFLEYDASNGGMDGAEKYLYALYEIPRCLLLGWTCEK